MKNEETEKSKLVSMNPIIVGRSPSSRPSPPGEGETFAASLRGMSRGVHGLFEPSNEFYPSISDQIRVLKSEPDWPLNQTKSS
jgi:hypothetical protein